MVLNWNIKIEHVGDTMYFLNTCISFYTSVQFILLPYMSTKCNDDSIGKHA